MSTDHVKIIPISKKWFAKKRRESVSEVKEVKKNLSKNRVSETSQFAQFLRFKTPRSEKWFLKKWKLTPFYDQNDLLNYPFGPYIPDLRNGVKKIIIEVDGSIHQSPRQKWIDQKKDEYYRGQGYRVFRVKAYSENSFRDLLKNLEAK